MNASFVNLTFIPQLLSSKLFLRSIYDPPRTQRFQRSATTAARSQKSSVRASVSPYSPLPPRDTRPDAPGFSGWSSEFTRLCDEQLELLQTSVPGVATAVLFFRREHPTTGALEFVPLAASPNDPRVWIAGSTTTRPADSRVLPGGIPAVWILPDYPYLSRDAQLGFVSSDGSLCMPILFSSMIVGSLVLGRPAEVPASTEWESNDVNRVRIVARSIALAAVMEGRWLSAREQVQQDTAVLSSLREVLQSALHQIRSPVTALVTFGRLLLKKLPPGDTNRGLAKSIVLASFRLNDLLAPLDNASANLKLLAAPGDSARAAKGESEPELLWVSDILAPLEESTGVLAESRDLEFLYDIDDDSPPVMSIEFAIREAVSNCIDNALKYTPSGGMIGLKGGPCPDDRDQVEVIIWDTGPGVPVGEQSGIWESSRRGSVGLGSDENGSGLGLFLSKKLVQENGGSITLQSPIVPSQLAALMGFTAVDRVGPGTLIRIRLPRAAMG
jgi:signal transduction histidine kinase